MFISEIKLQAEGHNMDMYNHYTMANIGKRSAAPCKPNLCVWLMLSYVICIIMFAWFDSTPLGRAISHSIFQTGSGWNTK